MRAKRCDVVMIIAESAAMIELAPLVFISFCGTSKMTYPEKKGKEIKGREPRD